MSMKLLPGQVAPEEYDFTLRLSDLSKLFYIFQERLRGFVEILY
jgi:hypothetical protein